MQITFKTKRGAVVLSLQKLRLFRRVAVLEERVDKLERILMQPVETEGRTVESHERNGGRLPEADFSASDAFVEWTEGEEVAKRMREERLRGAEERAERGGDGV